MFIVTIEKLSGDVIDETFHHRIVICQPLFLLTLVNADWILYKKGKCYLSMDKTHFLLASKVSFQNHVESTRLPIE